MTRLRIRILLLMAVLTTATGCQRGPVLTSRQVEQVLETQAQVAEQQASLGRGRDDLEADRRIWDQRERTDPIIAETIEATGILLTCCVPLAVLYLLLGNVSSDESENAIDERLLSETLSPTVANITAQDEKPDSPKFPVA